MGLYIISTARSTLTLFSVMGLRNVSWGTGSGFKVLRPGSGVFRVWNFEVLGPWPAYHTFNSFRKIGGLIIRIGF